MNIVKKSLFACSIVSLLSLQPVEAFPKVPALPTIPAELLNPKDLAKLTTWLVNAGGLGYYFFHRPEDRLSKAPFERVLQGRWENPVGDTFNWDNVENFSDIFPGQRWKVYSYKFDGRSGAKLTITAPGKNDIKGFGLYHFCEKNMKKIVKLTAALAVSYGLLSGKLNATSIEEFIKQLATIILSAYGTAGKVVSLEKAAVKG